MERNPRKYLWDAREAADAILSFSYGKTLQEFERDPLLRSAVERQFEIIGEALNQLSRRDPALAQQIPDLGQIVAFRNLLVHGCAIVDEETVWRAVQDDLPAPRETLRRLLEAP